MPIRKSLGQRKTWRQGDPDDTPFGLPKVSEPLVHLSYHKILTSNQKQTSLPAWE